MQSVLWMREFSAFSAFGAVDVGARYNRYGEWVGGGAEDCVRGVSCVLVSLSLGGLSAGCPKTYLGYG